MAIAEYKYQTNAGSIFKVRMDDDAALDPIRGAAPTVDYTEQLTVKTSKNNRVAGLEPRHVLFGRAIGSQQAGTVGLSDVAVRYKRVICLTQAALNAIVTGSVGGAGVTNFSQNGATYYALKVNSETVR